MEPGTRVLVCGGGNGAHTCVTLAASAPNVEANLLTLYSDEAERWTKVLGDEKMVIDAKYSDGTTGQIEGKPRVVTKDPAVAMEGVSAVIFVVPAFAHQQYFDAIKPFLKHNIIIVGMPGQAGFEFQAQKCLKDAGVQGATISLESLPWATRIIEFGRKVQVLGFKAHLEAALIAGKGTYKINPLKFVQNILGEKPQLNPAHNYIVVSLMADSIVHPPIMFAKWGKWDGVPLKEPPPFYQGVDDEQAAVLLKVSDEVMDTSEAIKAQRKDLDMSGVIHLYDWYKIHYHDQISDDSSLKSCMRTNKAYNGLIHPMKKTDEGYVPDFSYRYIAEDVPFGLVVMKGIAACVGVETPMMDTVIAWGQKILGKEYIVGSKLTGKDIKSSRAPQAFGFNTLNDLLEFI